MARDGPRAGGRLTVIEKLRNIVEWGSRKFVMGAKNKTRARQNAAATAAAARAKTTSPATYIGAIANGFFKFIRAQL